MRSYNIWNKVTACIYKGGKSYGANDTGEVTIVVGTSARNSEFLVRHVTTKRIEGDYTVFRFGLDLDDSGHLEVLKTKWMDTQTKEWFDEDPTAPIPDALAERARAVV